jgi:adenine-specific DNA-methyltransferase
MSPFCKKDKVKDAFIKLVGSLKAEWVFISYNSESLIGKDAMLTLLRGFGEASVIEREYKRFKSFEYNEDKKIMEYLFCLKKPSPLTPPRAQ